LSPLETEALATAQREYGPDFFTAARILSPVSACFPRFSGGIGSSGILALARAPYFTRQNIFREQPVQFSHNIMRATMALTAATVTLG